jgi:hypothetical protein
MNSFKFSSSLLSSDLSIQQKSDGLIGTKIYPGALLLCEYIENNWKVFKNKCILELGAGACALPSLLLSKSSHIKTFASDTNEMQDFIKTNICNNGVFASCSPLVLYWGSKTDVDAFIASCEGRYPDEIIGADIIYHDELISPLIDTMKYMSERLLELTGKCVPFTFTYVQRFKRAKKFFALGKKHFKIERLRLKDVVDYDALNWSIPLLHASNEPVFTSSSASYESYCKAVLEKAEHVKLTGGGPASEVDVCTPVHHAVDSDTDEEERSGRGKVCFMFKDVTISTPSNAASVGADVEFGPDRALLESTHRAAEFLQVPLYEPLKAYLYTFTYTNGNK